MPFIFMPMKVRIAARQIEKKLMDVAKEIKSNPEKIIPECRGNCRNCYFERLRKEIKNLKDEKNLERMAKKKGFLAAVAATILLADEERIPYVAHLNIAGESVYYARRGKAKDEMLVGIQNWDKPHLRMLAYMEIAKKKRLNLFSLPDKIICSNDVPEEFLDFMQKKFSCDKEEYIEIIWRGRRIKACGNGNTLMEMKHYFYYPDFEKEIEIKVRIKDFECMVSCNECIIEDAKNEGTDVTYYISGEMGDKKFLKHYKNKIRWNIEKKRVFIAGKRCYGNDVNAFLNALSPKEWEREAIKEILKYEQKAIILEQPSSTKLLQKYEVDVEKLKEEYYDKRKKEMLDRLPEIGKGEMASFIDNLARIYKVEGKEGVIKAIKTKEMDVKKKAIVYAFLLAMEVRGEEWKYSKMEQEFGRHLSPYIKKLMEAEGEEYKRIGQKLLREVG